MKRDMRTIQFGYNKRGANILHIEVPGCIVNIYVGLHDTEGHEVTRVDVKCDDYSGESEVTLPDFDNAKFLGIRVVRGAQLAHDKGD